VTGSPYKAPRFHAIFERLEARRVLLMSRSEWEWVRSDSTGKVLIDITETPMAKVGTDASLIAAISERHSDYELSISVYREDLKDAPWTINTDQYRV